MPRENPCISYISSLYVFIVRPGDSTVILSKIYGALSRSLVASLLLAQFFDCSDNVVTIALTKG